MDGPLVDISLLSQNLFSGWLHLLKRASAKENCQKGTPPPGRGGMGGSFLQVFVFLGGMANRHVVWFVFWGATFSLVLGNFL